jgi:hypothetical protein
MALELVPPADPAVAEAARRALAETGSESEAHECEGRWWRAGIADVVEARAVVPALPAGYSALASPRSTRGATRA